MERQRFVKTSETDQKRPTRPPAKSAPVTQTAVRQRPHDPQFLQQMIGNQAVLRLSGSGHPLRGAERVHSELRIGHDFSRARVYSGLPAPTTTPTHRSASSPTHSTRRCACGGILGPSGECEACRAKRLAAAPHALDRHQVVPRSLQASSDREGVLPGDRHAYDGKSECSSTWYGETIPEVDDQGRFTGNVKVKYNAAELTNPCVRDCVVQHEAVHVSRLVPILRRIRQCDVEAGNDPKKQDDCTALSNRELLGEVEPGECAAYQKSYTCLTLKILDAASPCSKPPLRDEIQKHRQRESCELQQHCTAAKTPGAGIPNV